MIHDPMETLRLLEDLTYARDYRLALERVREASSRPETFDDELRQASEDERALEELLGP